MGIIGVTRLHLLLFALVVFGAGSLSYFAYQKRKQEVTLRIQLEAEERHRIEEAAKMQQQELEKERLKSEVATLLAVVEQALQEAVISRRKLEEMRITFNGIKNLFLQGNYLESMAAAKLLQRELSSVASEEVVRYLVQRGDTLWSIAKRSEHLGLGSKWYDVWKANQEKIIDFDLILPHQEIVIPLEQR